MHRPHVNERSLSRPWVRSTEQLSELRNLLREEKVEDTGGTLQADSLTLWEKKDSLQDSCYVRLLEDNLLNL